MPDLVKVLDFGLVKAQDEKKGMEATNANSLLGTPLYMSPEAIENPTRVDARSDLYAVGAVGYFLMTGEPVFNAPTLVELCRMHVAEPPKPPSVRTGRRCRPNWKTRCWRAWKNRRRGGRKRPAIWRCDWSAAASGTSGRPTGRTIGGTGTRAVCRRFRWRPRQPRGDNPSPRRKPPPASGDGLPSPITDRHSSARSTAIDGRCGTADWGTLSANPLRS